MLAPKPLFCLCGILERTSIYLLKLASHIYLFTNYLNFIFVLCVHSSSKVIIHFILFFKLQNILLISQHSTRGTKKKIQRTKGKAWKPPQKQTTNMNHN
jgi:hypothetical protein